jgi:hypothetical protein
VAPLLLPGFQVPSVSFILCHNKNTRLFFHRLYMSRKVPVIAYLIHLSFFKHIFLSFLNHLHQFHLLSNLLGITFSSFLPTLARFLELKEEKK